jgi:hypothetical protein
LVPTICTSVSPWGGGSVDAADSDVVASGELACSELVEFDESVVVASAIGPLAALVLEAAAGVISVEVVATTSDDVAST